MHRMNKDALPSLPALDVMVKEKKVKISLFSCVQSRSYDFQ